MKALEYASITPKRVLLQTGVKHYGLHLGPAINPQHECDKRILLEPNFYYLQEDLLFEYSKRNNVSWNIVRPSHIIGAVKDAAMNLVYPLGVFGAIHAHLQKPLVYPGDVASFDLAQSISTAKLNAYLEKWAVLDPDTANQVFNASDSSQFTFGKFWINFAKWYGLEYELPSKTGVSFKTSETPYDPPPRGYVE